MNSYPAGFTFDHLGRWITSKDPDDERYYGRTIEDHFPGRTIVETTIAEQSGVTASNPAHSGAAASVFVIGGTLGQTGFVTLRCRLDNNERTDLTLWFLIEAH